MTRVSTLRARHKFQEDKNVTNESLNLRVSFYWRALINQQLFQTLLDWNTPPYTSTPDFVLIGNIFTFYYLLIFCNHFQYSINKYKVWCWILWAMATKRSPKDWQRWLLSSNNWAKLIGSYGSNRRLLSNSVPTLRVSVITPRFTTTTSACEQSSSDDHFPFFHLYN